MTARKITRNFRLYFYRQKALFHRNYRLFMAGQVLSLTGTWIQRLAMMWLAYQLTGSEFLLGMVAFCEQIPILLLAPLAGVYADRWNKHKALIYIEGFGMLQAILLGILTLAGMVNIWHIMVLSLCLGVINAFEIPIRQAFVVEMVDRNKKALASAIALNSTTFNLSRLVGPSVAGMLISAAGEGWCFLINGISYGAVMISLLLMRVSTSVYYSVSKEDVFSRLREGVRYIASRQGMRNLLLLLAVISFANASLRTLAPVFAQDILHGDAQTLGYLMSAAGVGAITGALYLTNSRSAGTMIRIISSTGILLGISIVCFAFSGMLVFSLLFIAIAGLSQMLHTASTNTLLQLYTDDDKRGRVMSFYTVCLQGTMPLGSLLAGSLAGIIGGPWAMALMGSICLGATFFYRKTRRAQTSPQNRH
ncbi:putative MFS family arabinose efflux permease [Anseongella ginsenosidimutans]|uniref:Putative MFS family arabinose efflux permease n=1 Tax=Anseongella ginsenosidimutans TaxID=496056 RepID=A0A4R3KSP6_9SPHI|nr:MFS transporter [Anseongella ginsenosidimutans]QEC52873.1 MFS transporter [Anseongella ginsenosidimutans]TCS87263.1 putative MFS family arabinose efflux permease [Anseongella ginsenosidimutans]